MIRANFHTHTTLCDGKNTPQEMAKAGFDKGLLALGFSGHMDQDVHMDWDAYATAIRQLKDEYRGRMDILMGVELDTLYDPACCPGAEYRIGSTHFLDVDVPCETSVDWSVEKLETCASRRLVATGWRLSVPTTSWRPRRTTVRNAPSLATSI